MSRHSTIHVVANLSLDEVSWARSFLDGCAVPGITTGNDISPDADINLFIGDTIDWAAIREVKTIKAYFLAATSFNAAIKAMPYEKETEYRNLMEADIVLLPSRSELQLISAVIPGIAARSLVPGFPLRFDRILPLRKEPEPRTACFVSRISEVKNNDFRKGLSAFLTTHGFTVTHYLAGSGEAAMQPAGDLAGNGLPLSAFLESCAQHRFIINVSKYESLSVSSIQASLLGCIPVCPAHSGFMDWCPASNTYEAYTYEAIWKTMETAVQLQPESLQRYDAQHFFKQLTLGLYEKL